MEPVEVRTFSAVLSASVTADNVVYTPGDAIGSLLSLEPVRPSKTGVIQSVTLSDLNKQKVPINIVFFSSQPTASTINNNAPVKIGDGDVGKIIGFASIGTDDYIDFIDNSVACKTNLGLVFQLTAGETIYACLITRSTPQYAGSTDISVKVGMLLD